MYETKTTVSAHLTLIGDDFDQQLVSRRLGITPTYLRRRDEVLGNGRLFGHAEWGVGSDTESSWDIEVQLEKVLSHFRGMEEEMLRLTKECNAEWHIVIVIMIENGDVPVIMFSQRLTEFCSKTGAVVGFDIYVLSARSDGVTELSL